MYIAPLKALARERIDDWDSAKSFKGLLNKKIVELTGDTAPDQTAIEQSDIIITTPEVRGEKNNNNNNNKRTTATNSSDVPHSLLSQRVCLCFVCLEVGRCESSLVQA